MKRIRIALLSLLVLAVPVFVFTSISGAGSFHSGNNVVIDKGQTIDHTLFVAGNSVVINGTIKGDVFCAGSDITINATVEGDVLCAGMNVDIAGMVLGDVRAAGQIVTLSGVVNGNASLAGNIIKTGNNSVIGRDLQAGGNTVTLYGKVGRDADLAGAMTTVSGKISRDIQAATDELQVTSGAIVGGSVTYYSHNTLTKSGNARVNGKVSRHDPPKQMEQRNQNPVPGIVFSFLALLVFAYVLLAAMPRQFKTLTDLALTKPGMTALIGFAACIGVPIVILLSFLTVVGALVGVTLLLAWIIVLIVSWAIGSYYLGRLILYRRASHPFIVMLVGVLAVSILCLIPIISVLTFIAVGIFGSGMIIRWLFAAGKKPRYDVVMHPTHK